MNLVRDVHLNNEVHVLKYLVFEDFDLTFSEGGHLPHDYMSSFLVSNIKWHL